MNFRVTLIFTRYPMDYNVRNHKVHTTGPSEPCGTPLYVGTQKKKIGEN